MKVIKLSVVMLNVVMQNVVAPIFQPLSLGNTSQRSSLGKNILAWLCVFWSDIFWPIDISSKDIWTIWRLDDRGLVYKSLLDAACVAKMSIGQMLFDQKSWSLF